MIGKNLVRFDGLIGRKNAKADICNDFFDNHIIIRWLERYGNMARRKTNTGIPGLSFSWKRALGISQARQKIARATGIPTTRAGVERKIGQLILKKLFHL